jgi:anti-anti-sigma factor
VPERTTAEAVVVVTEAFEGAATERWGRLITAAAARRPDRLVVDLGGSPRIDAAAIGVLLRTHRAMVVADRRLTLRNPGGRVRWMLSLARLDQVFDVEGSAREDVTKAARP